MPTEAAVKAEETLIHVLWINAGLSCDGDSVALTAATQPSVEEIALGALPGLPKVAVHWPLIDFECGPNGGADDFLEWFFRADRGELEPFVLVLSPYAPHLAEEIWERLGHKPSLAYMPWPKHSVPWGRCGNSLWNCLTRALNSSKVSAFSPVRSSARKIEPSSSMRTPR